MQTSNAERPPDVFAELESRRFGPDQCFLCGRDLSPETKTEEHVVPAWLQQRHDLWNQTLTLLNGTVIQYRYLKVPCCLSCNGRVLKPLEDRVARASLLGAEAVRALGEETLFFWLGKIFWGVLYRELSLAMDRSSKTSPSILSADDLQKFRTHLLFMQALRGQLVFKDFLPGTVRVFGVKPCADVRDGWYFCDNYHTMFVGVVMGAVGLFASLADVGAQSQFDAVLAKHASRPLHPLQALELLSQHYYLAALFNRVPRFISSSDASGRVTTHLMPIGGLSGSPLFDEWNPEAHARILAHMTQIPLDRIFVPPDKVMTWLSTETGEPRDLTFDEQPWPPTAPQGDSATGNHDAARP